jgi:DNA-binding transcriptional LysR family regulator
VDATLKGLGIVQLPDYYVEDYLQSGELISLLDDFREHDEGIWAVYPQNRHLSPKIRLLVDYLAKYLV